jgi:hypothetical protein
MKQAPKILVNIFRDSSLVLNVYSLGRVPTTLNFSCLGHTNETRLYEVIVTTHYITLNRLVQVVVPVQLRHLCAKLFIYFES